MKDGTFIKRVAGESLVQAARRLAPTPRVMFVTINPEQEDTERELQSYQLEKSGAWIEDEEIFEEGALPFEDSDEEQLDAHWYGEMNIESETEGDQELRPGEVYLTVPRKSTRGMPMMAQVHNADRTISSTRTARAKSLMEYIFRGGRSRGYLRVMTIEMSARKQEKEQRLTHQSMPHAICSPSYTPSTPEPHEEN
jgi:hypothetical protein